MLTNVIIPDEIEDIVTQVRSNMSLSDSNAPYFYFGHYQDIVNLLLTRDRKKQGRYPMIALILPNDEQIEMDENNAKVSTVKIIIATKSKIDYTPSERLTNVFKATLYPLYREFLNQIILIRKFQTYGITDPYELPHTKVDRYFIGSESTNQNKLNDYADAIELDIELTWSKDYICN